jgi:hypothetical protein
MPSTSPHPTFTIHLVRANPPHPEHPAFGLPELPFTLTQGSPGNYVITCRNTLTRNVRIFCQAFTDPANPLWNLLPEQLAAGSIRTLSFAKSSLNGATTIWLGSWWDDDTCQTAAAYFAAHPAGGGHHTVPVTTG